MHTRKDSATQRRYYEVIYWLLNEVEQGLRRHDRPTRCYPAALPRLPRRTMGVRKPPGSTVVDR